MHIAAVSNQTPAAATPSGSDLVAVASNRLSALAGDVLSPFAATSDAPVPTDPPSVWTVLAWARRELFNGPTAVKSTLAQTTENALTVTENTVLAPRSTTVAPAAPSLLTSVISPLATAFFNVFDSGFAAIAGPPVLPPGSTVTVQTSTLQFDNGYTAPANWYFPADPKPQGLIYLQHGFLVQGAVYSYTAAALAEQTHSIVVAPTITSNFFAADGNWLGGAPMQAAAADLFLGDHAALTASASAAAGHPVTLPQRVVLVGHSLGGGFVTGVAGDMVDNGTVGDLAGVILLDGVAFDLDLPATTLGKVPGNLPILLIASEPYIWDLYGQMSADLTAARPGRFNGVELVGGRHIDALQGGKPLIQFAEYVVAGFSRPQNIDAVKVLATGWINDMFACTHTGIYAVPGQPIQIATDAGPANAFAVPAPPTPLTPIKDVARIFITYVVSLIFNIASEPGVALLASSTPATTADVS